MQFLSLLMVGMLQGQVVIKGRDVEWRKEDGSWEAVGLEWEGWSGGCRDWFGCYVSVFVGAVVGGTRSLRPLTQNPSLTPSRPCAFSSLIPKTIAFQPTPFKNLTSTQSLLSLKYG